MPPRSPCVSPSASHPRKNKKIFLEPHRPLKTILSTQATHRPMKKPNAPRFVILQKNIYSEKSWVKTEEQWQERLNDNKVAINPDNVSYVAATFDSMINLATHRTSSVKRVGISFRHGNYIEVDGTLEEVLAALSK